MAENAKNTEKTSATAERRRTLPRVAAFVRDRERLSRRAKLGIQGLRANVVIAASAFGPDEEPSAVGEPGEGRCDRRTPGSAGWKGERRRLRWE